jgi:hypothetical protein
MRATFDNLSLRHKLLLVEDMGTEILSIEYYDHRIHLYAFDSMLVEKYQNIETKAIEKFTVCTNADLDKFLCRITLPLHEWNTRKSNQHSDPVK